MYTVLNAEIPVICIRLSIHIHVECVIRHSVTRALLYVISAYIVVSDLMPVQFVIRHSLERAILQHINACIVIGVLILVKCVIRHSIDTTI